MELAVTQPSAISHGLTLTERVTDARGVLRLDRVQVGRVPSPCNPGLQRMTARDERVVWVVPGATRTGKTFVRSGRDGCSREGEEAMLRAKGEIEQDREDGLRTKGTGSGTRHRKTCTRARRVSSVLTMICLLVVSSTYVFVVAPGSARAIESNPATEPASSCSPTQLIAEQQSVGSGVNTSRAVQAALSTPSYSSALAAAGQSASLSFNSAFDLFTLDVKSCSVALASVNVVFSADNATSAENLIAVENPISFSVSGVSVQSSSVIASQHAQYLWGGWEMPIPSSYSPYGQWTVPILSAPPGCPPIGVPCPYGFTTWVGQTVVNGGTGWISQTGTDHRGVADCFIFFCNWNAFSGAWYEFWPANQVSTFGVNSGDGIWSYSTYSAGTYAVDTIDLTSGQGHYASMRHSSVPAYAQFTSENDQIFNQLGGVNLAPPNFGHVTVQGEMQISSNNYLYDLLVLNPYPYTNAININVGNIVYQGPCGHHSCFTLTYV
jgi:hypothetical protein